MADRADHGFATRAIHSGEAPDPVTGALNPPLYQTSTYAFTSLAEKQAILSGEQEGYFYTRDGNPTVRVYERKHAALEGAEDALLGASGMGVIAASILSTMAAGMHLLASDSLYSVAETFFRHDLPRLGIGVTPVDITDLEAVRAALHPSTVALYVESLSNPTLKVADLRALADLAHARGVLLIVDNTFASPYLLRPIEHGADLVVHSATKYLSGHGDVVAGVVAGSADLIGRARTMLSHLGAPVSPFNAWLLLRGIKTLELRMERHSANALTLAHYLATRPEVTRVYYPGLETHPGHELAAQLLDGQYGGMLAFELAAGCEAAQQFADALELCAHAVSLGDVSTLVWPWNGCSLVRVSVGIETIDDLIADIDQALRVIGAGAQPEIEDRQQGASTIEYTPASADDADDSNRRLWETPATVEFWRYWQYGWDHFVRPATDLLLAEASIVPGMHVLDVGSGHGEPALTLAYAVGTDGHVTATDFSAPMLALAEEQAAIAGLTNLTFSVTDAADLPFAVATFDAAASRFSMMYVVDVAQACREIRRVLTPGRRFTCVVWGPAEDVPWYAGAMQALAPYLDPPPIDPSVPGPFRFSSSGTLSAAMTAGGFSDVVEAAHEVMLEWPDGLDSLVTFVEALHCGLIDQVPVNDHEQIRAALRSVFQNGDRGDVVQLPARIIVASGRA